MSYPDGFKKQPVQNAIAIAVVMKANNPQLSVSTAAKAVGVSYSVLKRHELWRHVCNRIKARIRSGLK